MIQEQYQDALSRIPSLEQVENLFQAVQAKPRQMRDCVVAIASVPRLGFTAHAHCASEAFVSLGIPYMMGGGVFWGQSLTRMIEQHMNDGTKYILTLDYDTLFTPDDIVALFILMESHPEADAISSLQLGRGRMRPLFTITDQTGEHNRFASKEELAQDLVQIKTSNFALTMMRANAFASVAKPWFLSRPDEDGCWGEGRIDEDIAFWIQWAECGNTLFMAPRVVVGHMEEVATWPDRDLQPIYQSVREYLNYGKPVSCLNRSTKAVVGTDEQIKLDIGSGAIQIEGYTPIDRSIGLEAYPLDYPDNSVVEIRASHVLEHFPMKDVQAVVADWVRVLRPGGVLKVAVPDFDQIIKAYSQNTDSPWASYLLGGQQNPDDYHRSVFTRSILKQLLEGTGLSEVETWNSEIGDCASLQISLNLQGRKI